MAKLYFYDTGLVCSLLGIQNASQLQYHPLSGSLFENFVIGELVKSRFNGALGNNLYFWRDNVGHEIDVIIDHGTSLYPVEIKSGQTVTQEYFRNLMFWQSMTGDTPATVVYAGATRQQRSNGVEVIPWKELENVTKKPGTCNLEPATWNLPPATCNLQSLFVDKSLFFVIFVNQFLNQ